MATVVELDHLGSGYWRQRAAEQKRLGHLERALRLYQTARKTEDSAPLRREMAETYLAMQSPGPARRLYEINLAMDPPDAESLFGLAQCCAQTGLEGEKVRLLDLYLRAVPVGALAERARDILWSQVEGQPARPRRMARAETLLRRAAEMPQGEERLALLRRSWRRGPSVQTACLLSGSLLAARPASALRYMEYGLAKDPENRACIAAAVLALQRNHREALAERMLRRLIPAPDLGTLSLICATAHRMQRLDLALAATQDWLERYPCSCDGLILRIKTLFRSDREEERQESEKLMQRLGSLSPDEPFLQQMHVLEQMLEALTRHDVARFLDQRDSALVQECAWMLYADMPGVDGLFKNLARSLGDAQAWRLQSLVRGIDWQHPCVEEQTRAHPFYYRTGEGLRLWKNQPRKTWKSQETLRRMVRQTLRCLPEDVHAAQAVYRVPAAWERMSPAQIRSCRRDMALRWAEAFAIYAACGEKQQDTAQEMMRHQSCGKQTLRRVESLLRKERRYNEVH